MAEVSEPWLFTRLIEALGTAETCARGIGHSRGDTRWIAYAAMMQRLRGQVKRQAEASARQALHFLGQEMAKK